MNEENFNGKNSRAWQSMLMMLIAAALILMPAFSFAETTITETTIPEMGVKTMVTGSESVPVKLVKYTQNSRVTVEGQQKTGTVYRLDTHYTGILKVRILAKTIHSGSIDFGLYESSDLNTLRGETSNLSAGQSLTKSCDVSGKTSLYLVIYTDTPAAGSFTDVVTAQPYFYACRGNTLDNNVKCVFVSKAGHDLYFKFKAVKTGSLCIYGYETGSDTFQLCNSQKKALSPASTAKYARYGVKSGRTYYIHVRPSGEQNICRLKPHNKYLYEYSGRNRAAAVMKYRDTQWSGTIVAGSSTADWYRVKIGSRRSFRVYGTGYTCGRIDVKLYNKKGLPVTAVSGYADADKKSISAVSKKLKKGTYYIRVSRASKKSSGYYKLKWK